MSCFSNFLTNATFSVTPIISAAAKYVWEEKQKILYTGIAITAALTIHNFIKKRNRRTKWNSVGENIIVLHAPSRARTCPNLSPFTLKLEAYFRMAGFKYEHDCEAVSGPKHKTPWITMNGEDFADSQLIMDLLGKKFNKDFCSHLSKEQKAIGRAMAVMTEERMFWGIVWWRFEKDPDVRICDLMNMPYYVYCIIKSNARKTLYMQGLGRHTEAEIVEFIRQDLEALSNYLGDKPFLTGDILCEFDCTIFGQLSQFVWGAPGSPFAVMMQSDFRNLLHYCIRIKEILWPEWDQSLLDRI